MKWLKHHRRLVIILGATLVAFGVVSWLVGGALVASANHTVGPPPGDLFVVATTLASESGSKIATWYIPAAESRATVVLLHPLRGDRRSMLGRARLFHEAGYAVVMIDMQAHGESPGERITAGYLERHDVRAAVEFARATNPSHRIGIVGCSMGGAAALLASPLGIDTAVLESVYPTVSEAVHDRVSTRVGLLSYALSPVLLCQLPLRLGISANDLRPIDHIAGIGCSVLIAAGDMDGHTTLAETQRMFTTASQPKKLVIFHGAAHVDLLAFDPDQYKRQILPFLARHLAAEPTDRVTVGLRPPSVPPITVLFNVFPDRDCLVFSTVTYLLALYSNKRAGKCLSYVGTEGRVHHSLRSSTLPSRQTSAARDA